jgi:hypothetical protein
MIPFLVLLLLLLSPLICYNQHAVLRSFLLKWQTSKALMNVPVTFLSQLLPPPTPPTSPLLHIRSVKDCKSILKTLNSCCVFSKFPTVLLKSCRVLQKEIYLNGIFMVATIFHVVAFFMVAFVS